MRRKRIKPLLLLAIVFLALNLSFTGILLDLNAANNKPVHLTILYTTDLYGKLRDFRCKRPGVKGINYEEAKTDFANLLYQVNRIRREVVQKERRPAPLLFNTGDNLGTELAARFLLEFEGLAGVDFVADVFERFGYDLIGLGNHEFSVPSAKLRDFLMQARLKGLKFSAANIDSVPATHALAKYVNRDGAQKTKYFIFNRGGLKIGVFHVVPNELENQVSREAVKGVTFSDPASTAGDLVPKLRDELNVDLVIVLSHIEESKKPGIKVREFARSTPGIDIIITNEMRDKGNALSISSFNSKGKGVYIAGGAKYGAMLGRIDIKVRKVGGKSKLVSFQTTSIPLKEKHYNKELRRELRKWELSYCKRWGRPLGKGRIRAKKGMTHKQFMDYILNLMRRMTNTEIALINVGAVRKSPFPLRGYITKDDLYRALPFENKLVVLPIKGSDLNSLIEGYWDVNKPDSKKAIHFVGVESGSGTTINGRAVDDSGIYWITTIDYVAKESSGWLSIKKKYRQLVKYSDGVAPELRAMMIEHFGANRFRKLLRYSKPPKNKAPIDPDTGEPKKGVKVPPAKPFNQSDIPFNGNFMNLSDKIAWKFSSELGAGVNFIAINPININTFTQQDEFSGGFFQKLQMNGTFTTKLDLNTRMHLWKNTFSGAYNGDTSRQFTSGSSGTKIASIFQESEDKLELKTEYRFRYFEAMFPGQSKWYYTSPYVEARAESEISTGGRGFLSDKEFFKGGEVTERFHKFLMEFTAGLSFKLTDLLVVRVGATGKQELALNCRRPDPTKPGSFVSCDDEKVKHLSLTVRREFNGGFKIDYELQPWEFAKIGESPLSWESRAKIDLTFLIGGNKTGSMIYFFSENKLSFAISGNVSLAIGFKFYLHRGLFPEKANDNNSKLISGPIAVRLEPTFNLRFNWAKRGQAF